MQKITKKLMEGINLKFKKDPNLHIYGYSKNIKFCKYLLYYLLIKNKKKRNWYNIFNNNKIGISIIAAFGICLFYRI